MESPSELANRWGLTPHAALHLYCLLGACPGLVVTSGRRSIDRNRAVGGATNSFHLKGRAVDLALPGGDAGRYAPTARAQRVTPGCTGPEEVIDEGDHLHVAW